MSGEEPGASASLKWRFSQPRHEGIALKPVDGNAFDIPFYDPSAIGYATSNPAVEEPPPDFTSYEAEYKTESNGNIISHDRHLNEDGEALYRFLLSQSSSPPVLRIACGGTHTEHRSRQVRRDGHTVTEHYTETVTDFSFAIDVQPPLSPVHWTVADEEPACRGLMVQQVQGPLGKHKVTRAERKRHDAWVNERRQRGMPPWTPDPTLQIGDAESARTLLSSHTVREWADMYCASPKHLKEFVFVKVVHGWNIEQLEDAIRSYISTFYSDTLSVEIQTLRNKIYVRPDNRLARMLSNKWLKLLSIILLVFPFIWLFKRFHSRGGGQWKVAGAAYPMKRWVPLPSSQLDPIERDAPPSFEASVGSTSKAMSASPFTSTASSSQMVPHPHHLSMPSPRHDVVLTPDGPRRVEGIREGEWFKMWESTIAQCVTRRYISSSNPMTTPLQVAPNTSLAAQQLDGY
ncbi:hypothetical protein BD626DRAFT_396019 [Schizophyllum amplum]|uniref:Uncharacterized protein n=1 Tax=Schizophyllum amplum TaxID=97359 RepID=A0A550CTB5_9AGAR|nr:hypothetical protein BD626DRAFT_396019 [Auriculariopsis ampla]